MNDTPLTPSPVDAARIDRDQAEGAKLREEKAKLRAERREIELRLARPWYRKEGFFRALAGGLLALPVMWFFFDQIIRPVYTVENQKLWVDVEEARLEVRRKERALQEAEGRLAEARRELEAAWEEARVAGEEISRREATLKNQQARLVADYERLLAEEKTASSDLAAEVARLKAGLTAARGAFTEPFAIQGHRLQGAGVTFVPSSLQGRPMEAQVLVVQITRSNSLTSAVHRLQQPGSFTSVHLVIGRDGKVVQMMPFDRIASEESSIVISLENAGSLDKEGGSYRTWFGKEIDPAEVMEVPGVDGVSPTFWHKPTPVQINAAEDVVALLVKAYPIEALVGHDEINNQADPGPVISVPELRERFLATP